MAKRITKDSWKQIAERIIDIVEKDRDFGLDCFIPYDLETFLTDEGIIEVIKEREVTIVSDCKRIIRTYEDLVPQNACFGECDTTGSVILYVEDLTGLPVLKEYEVKDGERWFRP